MDLTDLRLEPHAVGHLPVVRGVMDRLGFVDVVNQLSPMHELARVSDGHCVAAMMLNILSGRMALFRMDEWLRSSDTELLLGSGCEPDAFNDTRLGQALDHIDEVGTDTIMGALVERYLEQEDRPTRYSVHTDSSSFSLYGAYDGDAEPNVTFGYSKDKRPDLKQLIFGLSLHGAVGLPLVATVAAGNTPDQTTNRTHLARLARLLPEEDEVTIVADCKIVDADSVGRVLCSGFHLVSLVPDAYSLRGELIKEAWTERPEVDDWSELARQRGRTQAAPQKVYSGRSVERPFAVLLRKDGDAANEPVPSIETMRFLVVHSTTLAGRFEKSLPNKLRREKELLERFERKAGRKGFDCDADARLAAHEVLRKVKLHQVEVKVEAVVQTLKRPRRGRPPAGEAAPTETRWHVHLDAHVDEQAVHRARRKNSCFVLITDKLEGDGGPTDAEFLAEYRHQYLVENHTGFRWLKSEGHVSPMFLKTPRRIRAMGLVLVLALMVRNYIQFTLRGELKRRQETLLHPFTKQAVDNLTTEMAMAWFAEIVVVHAGVGDGPLVRQLPQLRATARRILELLGLTIEVFARPPPLR